MNNPDANLVIAELHKRLGATLRVLGAHIEAHGMLDPREDETLAFGSLAHLAAIETGVIDAATGKVPSTLALLPVDDDMRPFSDPLLTDAMVHAGMDVFDRVRTDLANYVPGETIDWDDGMKAVAVYRAMTRAALARPYRCRLDIDDTMTSTIVVEISEQAAVRRFALDTFNAAQGEWMGGTVTVVSAENDDPDEEREMLAAKAILFGRRYDVSIDFEDGETVVTAVPVDPTKAPVKQVDPEALRIDAERFRAVASVPGAYMHGSAGFDATTGARKYEEAGQVHFGAELTTIGNTQFGTDWAHCAIKAIADDVLAMEGAAIPSDAIGTSDEADAARWGALMRLPRIRVMAHRGVVDETGAMTPVEPGTFWFKAEFWSKPPRGEDPQTEPTVGRLCLLTLADDVIAARARRG